MQADTKQLYNIETETLITLYAKGMILKVKDKNSATHVLPKIDFTIAYLLCISRPNLVTYEEIIEILESVDIEVDQVSALHKKVSNLRKKLKRLGVMDLIVNARGSGYAVSAKWVEPYNIGDKVTSRRRNITGYIKRLAGICPNAMEKLEPKKSK